MEKQKVIKVGTSKIGDYIQFEDKTYSGCTPAVKKFLESKVPCEIYVDETKGEGKDQIITKVTPLKSKESKDEFRLNIDAGNCIQRAVELICAGKGTEIDKVTEAVVFAFIKAKDLLEKGEIPTNTQVIKSEEYYEM